MDRLSDAARGAVAAIVGAPEAWVERASVESGHGAAAVAELVALGVAVSWHRTDYEAITLTPWGAWLVGVVLVEHWRPAEEEVTGWDDIRFLPTRRVERVRVEVPRWRESPRDDSGDPIPEEGPVVLPRHARLGVSLTKPERVPDHRAPAPADEYLLGDDGEPVKLFPSLLGGGVPVKIDRRMRGKAG